MRAWGSGGRRDARRTRVHVQEPRGDGEPAVRRGGGRGVVLRGVRNGRVGRRRGAQGVAADAQRRPRRVARLPDAGYKFKVVDDDGNEVGSGQVGELLLRGPGVTKGYWGDTAATEAALTDDGWLRTGDLARKGLFERSCSRDARRT